MKIKPRCQSSSLFFALKNLRRTKLCKLGKFAKESDSQRLVRCEGCEERGAVSPHVPHPLAELPEKSFTVELPTGRKKRFEKS